MKKRAKKRPVKKARESVARRESEAPSFLRPIKPLESLSRPALIALLKLALAGKSLCSPNPAPYEEVWEAGYAYRVGLYSPNCFILNKDRHREILKAIGLVPR